MIESKHAPGRGRSGAMLLFVMGIGLGCCANQDEPAPAQGQTAPSTPCPDGQARVGGECPRREEPRQAAPMAHPGMVFVPAGRFRMGSDLSDQPGPEHWVQLRAFYIDVDEVTLGAYAECVSAGACTEPDRGPLCNWGRDDRRDHPVNCVDREQAGAYCAWKGKRLPTEAEWEYVGRGPEGRRFPWGESVRGKRGCWNRYRARLGTCPVGAFPDDVSWGGVRDLGGNVAEWVADTACSYPYDATVELVEPYCQQERSPLGIQRGASWAASPPDLPLWARADIGLRDRLASSGMRCAWSEWPLVPTVTD